MQEQANRQVIERIQKLLALSQSSNEHEAALALAKAQALLAEHNLSMAEVQMRTGVKSAYLQRHFMLAGQDQWRRDLMTTLARFNFCDVVYWCGTVKVAVVGESENIEAVGLMYRFVEGQLEQLASSGFARYIRHGGQAHARSWKTSFYQGALQTIRQRLQAERTALEASSNNCRALLVVKETDLKEAMERFHPKVRRRAVPRRITALDGLSAGCEAGHQVRFRGEVERPRSLWP